MSEPAAPIPSNGDRPLPYTAFVARPLRRRYWLHALLFVATIFTTLTVGARLQHNFNRHLPAYSTDLDYLPLLWALRQPSRLLLGAPFSLTLMAILLAHEMGHFLLCLRYRVQATLPFFLPAPTLIGTLGAFIRIRSPIPSRRALFDIGLAGPIAGFVVAVLALAVGMMLSIEAPQVVARSELQFGYPLIFQGMWALLPLPDLAGASWSLADVYFHPVAIAAWVGMFATALNLVPGGQFDGGHIIYALAPRSHRAITLCTALLLVPMGMRLWSGWLIWAIVLLVTGTRHPRIPTAEGLDAKRWLLALFGLLMLLLTFVPTPFFGAALNGE
ncbi:MAG: site-2 protease family protein [Acidobacteria bacterium]|nr:site-2 protease family protein [Acidobacteriota bacterium]